MTVTYIVILFIYILNLIKYIKYLLGMTMGKVSCQKKKTMGKV